MAQVKVTRTKIVGGALYSKGGSYDVDKPTHDALKRAGAVGKAAAPAAAPATDDEETEAAAKTNVDDHTD